MAKKKHAKNADSKQQQSDPSEDSLPAIQVRKGHNLFVETLLDGYIWVVPNFLTASECADWIACMEGSNNSNNNDNKNTTPPPPNRMEHTKQRATRIMASRECYRFAEHNPRVAHQLWTRLATACPDAKALLPNCTPVGCNPNIRLYKYTKGMSFGKHIDGSDTLLGGHGETTLVTRMTILVYLSECVGGATRFDPPNGEDSIAYDPTRGSMLIHLHGDDCLLHQADVVERGTKYVLRTDLVYPTTRR